MILHFTSTSVVWFGITLVCTVSLAICHIQTREWMRFEKEDRCVCENIYI